MQSASRRRGIEIALLAITGVIALVTVGVELVLLAFLGDTGHEPSDLDLVLYGLAAVLGGSSSGLAIAHRRSGTTAVGVAASVCALLAVAAFVFAVGAPVWFREWYVE
jgi:hypothetical protein